MCAISMVMDFYHEKWEPYKDPLIVPSQTEIDDFHKLMDKAGKYDIEHNQPNCELEEKKQKLQNLANELGITINFP